MNRVNLYRDCNSFYLTQSIRGLSLYQRTKAIDKFVKQETKILENCVETEIRAIFQRNGINVYATDKNALNELFGALHSKNKDILVVDLFKDKKYEGCVLIGTSPNDMTVWLEDDELLECGIEVKEIEYGTD